MKKTLKKISLIDPTDIISKNGQKAITGGRREWCLTYCHYSVEEYTIISGVHCHEEQCPRNDDVIFAICYCED